MARFSPRGRQVTNLIAVTAVGAVTAILLMACGEPERERVVLASTTSTEDSGLFDELIPAFEAAHPRYSVVVVAVGTGQALELGRRKDVDVLLVHAPAAESAFVADSFGTERTPVMYNDFVLLGPTADPADVRGIVDVAEALQRIAAAGEGFVSRGDDSGTHHKELDLWGQAGLAPGGPWYNEAGLGMGDVLRLASERSSYTLSDRATYLSQQETLALDVLVEGDDRLFNPYGVIPVAGAGNPEGARTFRDWIASPPAQSLIRQYGVDQWGQPLFIPNTPADVMDGK